MRFELPGHRPATHSSFNVWISLTAAFVMSLWTVAGSAQDASPPEEPLQQQAQEPPNRIEGNVEQTEFLPPPTSRPPFPPEMEQYMPEQAPPSQLPGNVQEDYVPNLQSIPNPQTQLPGMSKVLQGLVDQARKILPPTTWPNAPAGIPQVPSYGEPDHQSAPRPKWIPLYAYSNDDMVTVYHNFSLFWWDKRPIPQEPKWIQLAPNVSKYWKGPKRQPCYVWCEPHGDAPGSFVFRSNYSGGPKGWLEYTGTRKSDGFPMYRYWFDPR